MSMDQLKVETIKRLFGSSRLSPSSIIYLIFLYFIQTRAELRGNVAIEKCCPRGQAFSTVKNNTCTYFGDHKQELYPLHSRAIRDENLTSCVNSKNWAMWDIENRVDVLIKVQNTCVDLLYDAMLHRTMPIVFECRLGSNGSNAESKEIEHEIDGVTADYEISRRFQTLRMCCGENQYFDRDLRECTTRREEVNITRFFEFLRSDFDFVTVVVGLPMCRHAILDYVIDVTTDLRVLPDASIEVRNLLISGIWCLLYLNKKTGDTE